MSYAALADQWYNPAQPSRTASASQKRSRLRLEGGVSTLLAVNAIPTYGTTHRIRALKDWGENWDGSGAVPVSPAAVERAIALVSNTYEAASHADIDWLEPHVTASPHGEVVLEWWSQHKKLTVYVTDAEADYIKVWGLDIDEEMDDGVIEEQHIAGLLIWLGE